MDKENITPNLQCFETLEEPNLPPVGLTIDSLMAAARRIAEWQNLSPDELTALRVYHPTQEPPQQENASLLLEWLQQAFDHLDPPNHQE